MHTIVSVTDEQQPNETTAQARARFEKLAMPAVNALYRQAMKLTNNPDDAQDLVQDTFERGFKAFDSFEDGSNFEAWMTTIERNAYFNQYAKAKRRPQRANDSTGEYDDWDIYAASEHSSEGLKSAEQEYLDAVPRRRRSWRRSQNSRPSAGRCSLTQPSTASRTSRSPTSRA